MAVMINIAPAAEELTGCRDNPEHIQFFIFNGLLSGDCDDKTEPCKQFADLRKSGKR